MSNLTTEKKASIFAEFGGKATNNGSIEGQIALLTQRIAHITDHLKANHKDHTTQNGLMQLVDQRKCFFVYLHMFILFLVCVKLYIRRIVCA